MLRAAGVSMALSMNLGPSETDKAAQTAAASLSPPADDAQDASPRTCNAMAGTSKPRLKRLAATGGRDIVGDVNSRLAGVVSAPRGQRARPSDHFVCRRLPSRPNRTVDRSGRTHRHGAVDSFVRAWCGSWCESRRSMVNLVRGAGGRVDRTAYRGRMPRCTSSS
jgi:hypothetical protein